MIEIKCKGADLLPLDAIVEFQGNLKRRTKADIQKIITSIKKYGFSFPFFVWNGSGENYCLDGHGRIEALAEMRRQGVDLPLFPIVYVEAKDEEEAKQKLLRLNSQYGSMTVDSVLEFMGEIKIEFDELQLPGGLLEFSLEDETQEGQDGEITEDVDPVVRRGEIWQLGGHRLMCGDATLSHEVEQLMDGEKADMVFTDPPYNIDYEGKTKKKLKIRNDKKEDAEFYEFLKKAFMNYYDHTHDGTAIYVAHADSERVNFQNSLTEAGYSQKQTIIWVKDSIVLGRQDYHWRHEPILYGWKEGQGAHRWEGDRKQGTVWEIRRPKQSKEHPTMKPVELCETAIKNSSKRGGAVIDLFGGSGSTLIACENLNRKCYMMELDEHYCDVIIRRWETRTGEKAVRHG